MKYYEVWGWDTFAGEDYFCGRYTTRQAAENERRKKEKDVAKTQDEEIRDTYSIVEITDEGIAAREKEQDRINLEKAAERFFYREHLTDCVRELLRLFKNTWQNVRPEDLPTKKEFDRIRTQKVEWHDERDCFTRISFDTLYNKKEMLVIGIGVSIRGRKYYGGGTISSSCTFTKPLAEMLRWADTKEAIEECADKIEILIDSFYKD